MDEERLELVRVDATGTAHPVGKTASQRMRLRQGAFRLMPAPSHLIVMRYVGEDGRRDPEDGPIFRLAGEITAPGAICDVVALIGQAGWKGELVVLDGAHTRNIFFEQSHVVAASSTVDTERMGEVLYRYGALTREQVTETAAAMTGDIRFGEMAVKLGHVTRERLYQLMGRQAEEIAYAVLLVADGMFFFLDQFDEKRIHTRQSLAVNGLLMEGVRRMDEMRYFRDRIPSDQHVPERVQSQGRDAPDETFAKVWAAIDGVRSIAEICRVVGQGEFEVTQALFQLVQSGHVTVQTPRPTGPAAVVALFNEAITLIFREVDSVGRGGEVRDQLAASFRDRRRGRATTRFFLARPAPRPTGRSSSRRSSRTSASSSAPARPRARSPSGSTSTSPSPSSSPSPSCAPATKSSPSTSTTWARPRRRLRPRGRASPSAWRSWCAPSPPSSEARPPDGRTQGPRPRDVRGAPARHQRGRQEQAPDGGPLGHVHGGRVRRREDVHPERERRLRGARGGGRRGAREGRRRDREALRLPHPRRDAHGERARGGAGAQPLPTAKGADPDVLHVVFLAGAAAPARVAALDPARSPPDELAVSGREIYLRCPNGMARTKITNAWLDATLATTSTLRNWRTVQKLAEMAAGG